MDYKKSLEVMEELNPEALKADGFDECIVGIAVTFKGAIFLYNPNMMIAQMVARDGMTEEEAVEYFEYNILGAYMGDFTPAYLYGEDDYG
jgi:hypothetical protein